LPELNAEREPKVVAQRQSLPGAAISNNVESND